MGCWRHGGVLWHTVKICMLYGPSKCDRAGANVKANCVVSVPKLCPVYCLSFRTHSLSCLVMGRSNTMRRHGFPTKMHLVVVSYVLRIAQAHIVHDEIRAMCHITLSPCPPLLRDSFASFASLPLQQPRIVMKVQITGVGLNFEIDVNEQQVSVVSLICAMRYASELTMPTA